MNQAVKFKNSGFCKFLEEIGEEFEYLDEASCEKKEESFVFKYFWVLAGVLLAYLVKELILVGCVGCFVFEVLREGIQKGIFLCVKQELKLSKEYFLVFYSEKAGDLFWTWVKEYCGGLEKDLETKLFQAECTNPKHFERVFNSIELNCLIKGNKSVWGILAGFKAFFYLKKLVNRAKAELIVIKLTKGQRKIKETIKIPKFFHIQKQIIEVLKGIKHNSYSQEQLKSKILGVKGLLEIDLISLNQRQVLKKVESKKSEKIEPEEQLVVKETEKVEDQQDNTIFVIEGQGEQEIKPRTETDYFFIGKGKEQSLNKLDLKEFIKYNKEN